MSSTPSARGRKLERRYFFETDMLYYLNTIRAVVHDVPIDSLYAGEK